MKSVLAFAVAAVALAAPVNAQDATPKPVRRIFGFPFGKKPEPTPVPATPAPTPTPKATPKPTPKATPKPAAKPVDKPVPAEKPVEKASSSAEEKLSEKFVEKPVEKPAAKPIEKPAEKPPDKPMPEKAADAPPAKPVEKIAEKPVEQPIETIVISKPAATPAPAAAAKAPERAAVKPPDKSAAPAVITSTVPPEPAQIVRSFFASLGKGDIDGAYVNLMKGSRIGERPEEVRGLKEKTGQAIQLFGAMHGYDLVDSKPVGDRLMRATYLSLGHELPLRWRFYFYKAETEWKLIDLRVDDKLTGIFDEIPDDAVRTSDLR